MFKILNIILILLTGTYAAANGFTDLPSELKMKISQNLPIKDLISFCQTSQQMNAACQSDSFWRLLLQRDYAGLYLPGAQNPKDLYKYLSEPYKGTVLTPELGSGNIGANGKPSWLIVRLTNVPVRNTDPTIRVGTNIYFHPDKYASFNPIYGQTVLFDAVKGQTVLPATGQRIKMGFGIKRFN